MAVVNGLSRCVSGGWRCPKPEFPFALLPSRDLLPGFHPSPPTEKVKKVDLALLVGPGRTLVTAKWSIRADREEQFMSDFQAYERLESAGQDFGYVLITNEFDAARLRAACERRRQNAPLFTQVVHISPAAVGVVYRDGGAEGASAVRGHIASGRLMSLEAWLESIAANPRQTGQGVSRS